MGVFEAILYEIELEPALIAAGLIGVSSAGGPMFTGIVPLAWAPE
jgi:hypothetical protein